MKVKIGTGTPTDCASLEVDGPVLKAYGSPKRKSVLARGPLVLAYHLHHGETVRATYVNDEEVYEVNL